LRVYLWIAFTEDGVARDQNFGSRPHHYGHRVETNTPIYLNTIAQTTLCPEFGQTANLVDCSGNEFLTAKPRINLHHQYIVGEVEHLAQGVHRRCRIDHHARQATVILDQMQGSVQVRAGLLVY
jgi:hypothetical protein